MKQTNYVKEDESWIIDVRDGSCSRANKIILNDSFSSQDIAKAIEKVAKHMDLDYSAYLTKALLGKKSLTLDGMASPSIDIFCLRKGRNGKPLFASGSVTHILVPIKDKTSEIYLCNPVTDQEPFLNEICDMLYSPQAKHP